MRERERERKRDLRGGKCEGASLALCTELVVAREFAADCEVRQQFLLSLNHTSVLRIYCYIYTFSLINYASAQKLKLFSHFWYLFEHFSSQLKKHEV